MIGTLLTNRYRVDAKLGEGGMGVVYKAHDTILDRPVAIKLLSSQVVGDGAERLVREARSVAQLDHPHIVAVHDAGEVHGQPFIVMQHVAGKSLREVAVTLERAIEIAKQLCQALDYAHSKRLIHRDIKPENIMLTDGNVAKLMDFGLARSEGRSRLTQAGMIVGTVLYMAPELVLQGEADARSDLYSLGCVLYELATGRPPFSGDDPISIISQHLQVPPVAPHWYNAAVSPELEGIILKLIAKDPAERYASARDVLAALEQLTITVPAPVEAAPVSPALLLGTVLRGRLVGRDAELRELKSSVELAASGHGQIVLVEGEPGIGKTRLLQEAQVYGRLRRFAVLVGRCYEQETGIPYLPFIELFQGRFREMAQPDLRSDLGPTASEFVTLVPEVRKALPDVEPSPLLEPVQERLRLFSSIAEYFTALSRRTPLVLVLEDLHWADAASLSLLQHLARALRKERVLILGSYRDVELDRKHPLGDVLREMNRERLYNRISLRRLPREGVSAMLRAMFELRNPVSDEFLDLLYRETEGNPFFVEEVMKSLVEEGAIYREAGGWERKKIEEIDVPQSIKEVIGRRLERVPEPCQRALSLAAVIGRRFRFEVLQPIGELREEELLDALEEAMRAQLIREEPEAGEVMYDFVHALVREVLYERLSLRRRMTFHQKVGETLERQYAGRIGAVVEDLAHHFTRAPHGEGLEKAIRYSLEAAHKAMGLFAHEEAVKYYQNATELLKELGDERRLAETNAALGEPFVHLDKIAEAVAAYERALKFYERQGTSTDVAQVHRLIGRALARHRDFSEAIPHLERALEGMNPEEHAAEVFHAHSDLARAKAFTGKIDEADQHATQALALAGERGTPSMRASAHQTLGLISNFRLELDASKEHYLEAIRLTRGADDPEAYRTLVVSLNNLAVVYQERGVDTEALPLLLEALEIAQRARNVYYIGFQNQRLAIHYFGQGDWQAAKRYANESLRTDLSTIPRLQVEHLLRGLEGDWEGAVSLARSVLEHARRRGDVQTIFIYAALLAADCLDLGRIQEARDAAVEAAGIAEEHPHFLFFVPVTFIPEALARGGDYERCEALCARGEALCRATNSLPGLVGALYGRAVLALERDHPDKAVMQFDEVVPLAKQFRPILHAHVLRTFARALTRRGAPGDLERAKAVLQECLTLLEQMGDTRKTQQVRTELSSLAETH